jgi:cytochrome o ubiquinol oxidase operon protein cyoD
MSNSSHKRAVVSSSHDVGADSKKAYITGFVLSVVLTLIAFGLVNTHVTHRHEYPSDNFMVVSLLALAVVQLFVQMVFFLHIRRGGKPRWNAWAFGFAVTVVVILVIGSLWIMSNLNHRMGYSPSQMNHYLKEQDRL